MDIYYEKNVINRKMRDNPKTAKIYNGIRIACGVLMAIGIFYLFSRPLTWEIIPAYVIVIAPTLLGILWMTRLIKINFCEYDYIISSNTLRIVRIYHETKRCTIALTEMINIERIGFSGSEEYKKLINYPKLNKITAFCNLTEQYLYIFGSVDGKKSMILCEYDEEFLNALKLSVSGYGVFADEIRKLSF